MAAFSTVFVCIWEVKVPVSFHMSSDLCSKKQGHSLLNSYILVYKSYVSYTTVMFHIDGRLIITLVLGFSPCTSDACLGYLTVYS